MKLRERQIDGFVGDPPPNLRAALIYGPDRGLVRERADILAKAVVSDPSDPFRISELTAEILDDDPARLGDEVAAMSLTGGRRVVRLRSVGNRHGEMFHELFGNANAGDGLVVAEAEALGPRDSLRKVFEAAADAVAIPCYEDSTENLERLVQATLGRAGLGIDADALDLLVQNLGSDRLVTRGELEKLVLYMGQSSAPVCVADVQESVGDSAAQAFDDIAYCCASGDQVALERCLTRGFLGGDAAVQILRRVAGHFQRLHLAAARLEGGGSPDALVDRLRPPVHFSRKAAFARQLRIWPTATLATALERLIAAEIDCKSTGSPDQAICRHTLMSVASFAAKRGPRPGGRR